MLLDDPLGPLLDITPALINGPHNPLDLNDLEDIYTVGESSSHRWRSFIDSDDWNPKQFHDTLLQRRAYHARCAWETSITYSMMEPDWLTLDAVRRMREFAHFNLRCVEIEMVTYQLTCGSIGITTKKQLKLYRAATLVYEASLYMAGLYALDEKSKEKLDAYKELKKNKPTMSENKKDLAIFIDHSCWGLNELLKRFASHAQEGESLEAFVERLKEIILALDEILVLKN